MNQFAVKILVFFSFLLVVSLSTSPYYVSILEHQQRAFEFKKQAFNDGLYTAIFIGSSRTRCALIPEYFDQLTGNTMVSYNFGLDVGLPPRTFETGKEFINAKPLLKYMFVELSGAPELMSAENGGSFPLWTRLKDSNFPAISKNFDRSVLSIFKPVLPGRDGTSTDYDPPCESPGDGRTPDGDIPTSEIEIKKAFLRNNLLENHDRVVQESALPIEYWEMITRFIQLAEERGIAVYFFIPPRIESDKELQTVLPIYRKLAKKNKLENAHNVASIYTIGTSMDNFHLNKKGALIFTKNLAEQFVENNAGR